MRDEVKTAIANGATASELVKQYDLPLLEADSLIKEVRGVRRRGPRAGKVERIEQAARPETVQRIEGKEEKGKGKINLIDIGALWLAVGIDIVLNVVVFITIAPDLLTQIGMGLLAPLVVLFSLRGWVKGGWQGKALWAMFALVVAFSDISFALYATGVQSANAGQDEELARLTAKVDHDQKALDELLAGYNSVDTGFRSELSVRQSAIEASRRALDSSEEKRSNYINSARSAANEAVLTADGLFQAIPDAFHDSRFVQIIFFTLIFVGLQLTILSAAQKIH